MKRILLVEDDADLRLLLEHVLFDGGYAVDVADSVAAATDRLRGRAYDLVLADGRLEDGTGMAVADEALETGARVLIITGYAFEFLKEELARYEFLLKPVRPDELLQAVERVLQSA
jgi:DNA-binding NtrC family response regulator